MNFLELITAFRLPFKNIWILLFTIFPLLSGNKIFAQGPGEITVLETDNSFEGVWSCVNDGYIYGVGANQRTAVLRKRENGQSFETRGYVTTLDPAYRIESRIYSTSTAGLIFVLVRNEVNNFFLLKSTDGGLTFAKVFTFGEGNGPGGANAQDVRLLRGLLELTRDVPGGGGTGTLFIGEYNINRARTPGSVNDRVRIMKSTDHGDTWTKVVEWNTNSSNQAGHIHVMKQDPYTGEIYIGVGDYDSRTGIIKWDGTSPWTDNRSLSYNGSLSGFRAYTGLQRYRTCDFLFDENYFYTFADTQYPNNTNGSESGIWRGRKNFSAYTRVDNQIFSYDPMHIGWFGEKIGNTFIFTTAREYMNAQNGSWRELNTQVYISHDGANWYRAGLLNWRDLGDPTESRYITNVFTHNDKVYFDCSGAAGHSSTIQCSLNRRWKTDEDAVILHPVFYVGSWNNPGSDNYIGRSPDAPRRTLANILNNDRISAGARVRISAGTFSEPPLYLSWANAEFQGRGSVLIEGLGMDQTHIVRSSGVNYGIRLDTARTLTNSTTPLILKDLRIYNTIDGGTEHTSFVIYNSDSYVRTINCRIGYSSNDDSPLVYLGSTGAKYVSENSVHTSSPISSTYKEVVKINGNNCTVNMKNCLVLNAYNAFTVDFPGTNFILKNCTFYGIQNNALVLGPANNTQPFLKNNIFSSGASPITDLSGITENNTDYNLYSSLNTDITDGGHSPEAGTSPGFVDPENGDFNLRSDSPAAMRGLFLTDVLYDIVGRIRANPPSLGAYENPVLSVTPGALTVDSKSGSMSQFSINSNLDWNIAGYDEWIDLSVTSGKGSRTVTVTTNSENASSSARNTRLTVSGQSAETVFVSVTQEADILTSEKDTEIYPLITYPNPVRDILRVEYYDEQFDRVYILNSLGSILKAEKVDGKVQQLDLSDLEHGWYIIEFRGTDNHAKRIKLLKL